jgi:hypothetical protein
MNPSDNTATSTADPDLAEQQARPGYGIPSQDLRPQAQTPLNPEEAGREANSVLAGGVLVAGAAAGAAIGSAVAGPVGVLVGASVGAVVGVLGGAAAGPLVSPAESSGSDEVKDTTPPASLSSGLPPAA